MEREILVGGTGHLEGHVPPGRQPDAEDVARILVRVDASDDSGPLLGLRRQRCGVREVAVAVRGDLLDVVVRLERIADRGRCCDRGGEVQHPEACRGIASRLVDVARGAAKDLCHLSRVEVGPHCPEPCRGARDERGREARPGRRPPVLAERARDEDAVAGRCDVDVRRAAGERRDAAGSVGRGDGRDVRKRRREPDRASAVTVVPRRRDHEGSRGDGLADRELDRQVAIAADRQVDDAASRREPRRGCPPRCRSTRAASPGRARRPTNGAPPAGRCRRGRRR